MEQKNDELYHFGVKGMKWGVRRYQNADGTLTPAGKKHQQDQVLRDVKKYGRYTSDHKKAMNSKNVALTSAIDKGKSHVDKLTEARRKLSDLQYDRDNLYDELHYKYYKSYERKNGNQDGNSADKYANEHASKEIANRMKKRIEEATAQYNTAKKEYDAYVKTVVDDLLGQYGNTTVRTRSDGSNSAADALSDIIFWDNAVEKNW